MAKVKALQIIGVIPARLGSTRLPRKVLREIQGKILVEQVYTRARRFSALKELYVATDSEEVRGACEKRKIPVLMTSANHPSGTDRIYEVMKKKPADIYVNIQGDEPLVRAEHLEVLLKPFSNQKGVKKKGPAPFSPFPQVTTLKTKISPEAARSPNVVKVVTNKEGWGLYFSRSLIPFNRDGSSPEIVYKHLGFYAYTKEALEKFHRLPPSTLEQTERLEQLRFLENGIPIFVAETPFDTIGVDTEEDLQRAEELLTKAKFYGLRRGSSRR